MASQSRSRWLLAGSALGFLVAAALGALWVLRHGLDSYRERIERIVAQSTGRPFHLQGPLELRLAPLAIETGPAQLGNPAGMAGRPFAAWRSARIVLELLPLLDRRLVVDGVRLEGLQVHLQRTADGRVNWAGWSTGAGREPPMRRSSLSIALRRLEIRGGEVDLTDGGIEPRAQLSALRVDAGPARSGPHIEIGSVRLTGQLWTRTLHAESPTRIDLAKIALSPNTSEVTVSHASLRLAESSAEASFTATEEDGLWRARGAFSAHVMSVRGLAEILGMQLPRTRDPKAFADLALTSDWTFEGGSVILDPLRAHVDDTTIDGRIAYRHAPGAPLLEVDLHGDRVDLDRYSTSEASPSGGSELTIAELRALPIHGTVTFDQVHFGGTEMHEVRLEMGSLSLNAEVP